MGIAIFGIIKNADKLYRGHVIGMLFFFSRLHAFTKKTGYFYIKSARKVFSNGVEMGKCERPQIKSNLSRNFRIYQSFEINNSGNGFQGNYNQLKPKNVSVLLNFLIRQKWPHYAKLFMIAVTFENHQIMLKLIFVVIIQK